MSWYDRHGSFPGGDVDGCVYGEPSMWIRLGGPDEIRLEGWDQIEGVARATTRVARDMKEIAAHCGLLKTSVFGGVGRVLQAATWEAEYQNARLLPCQALDRMVLELGVSSRALYLADKLAASERNMQLRWARCLEIAGRLRREEILLGFEREWERDQRRKKNQEM